MQLDAPPFLPEQAVSVILPGFPMLAAHLLHGVVHQALKRFVHVSKICTLSVAAGWARAQARSFATLARESSTARGGSSRSAHAVQQRERCCFVGLRERSRLRCASYSSKDMSLAFICIVSASSECRSAIVLKMMFLSRGTGSHLKKHVRIRVSLGTL